MKKLKLLTTASLSLAMLCSLPLTAQAFNYNFNGQKIAMIPIYNQGVMVWINQNEIPAYLDILNGSNCAVIPTTPPMINVPNGNGNNLENLPGTPEIPETPVTPETPETPGNGNTDTNEQHAFAAEVVRLVNQERAKNGLNPLTMATNVQAAAQIRATELQTTFAHTRPDGRSYTTALKEQNVSYMGAGENIAWGQKSPEEVMSVWMNSEGHRANILNSKYTTIGVGYLQGANGANYWTQLFTY